MTPKKGKVVLFSYSPMKKPFVNTKKGSSGIQTAYLKRETLEYNGVSAKIQDLEKDQEIQTSIRYRNR